MISSSTESTRSQQARRRYVVVIPAKNEEQNIRAALVSILNQTISPVLVLVMDDNSDDGTMEIVRSLESEYDNLKHCSSRSDREYELGGHVVRLFMAGKENIDRRGLRYDWIVKMDADLQCEPGFMEEIFSKSDGNKVGIMSGTPYFLEGNNVRYDTSPRWHTHGQFKIYNATCFGETGGPREHLGWDCADNIRAIDAGWETHAYRDIHYLMHREVGGKTSNKKGRINHGTGCYICGFDPVYFMMKVLHDLLKPPYLSGAAGLVRGYAGAALTRQPKVLTKPQRKLLRKLLWSNLWTRVRHRDFVIQQRLLQNKAPD